jgi:hypothetical protein
METISSNTIPLSQFTEAVLKLIPMEITESLSSAQLNWTLEALKRYILPAFYRSGAPESETELAVQAHIVADDIAEELKGLTGGKKWAWFLRKAYLARLQPIYEEASALAKAKCLGMNLSQADNKHAKDILERLPIIERQMQAVAPGTKRELGEIFSEIKMNCRYVLGQSGGVSLEIGHFMVNRNPG